MMEKHSTKWKSIIENTTQKILTQLKSIKSDVGIIKRYANNAKEEQHFYFFNGKKTRNIFELILTINELSDQEFLKHVQKNKNDYSEWLKFSLGEEELANKISKVKDRRKCIKILVRFLKSHL
jgi:hypothetical protein